MTPALPSLPARWAMATVRAYQHYLSPLKPPVCRFTPTCSEYTRQAILAFGALRGSWLGLKRLARCHPWSPGGYDPVPGAGADTAASATADENGNG